MNWTRLVDSAFCLRLVLALGHFLWQAAAVALLAAVAAAMLRRASAQLRYVVLLAALLLIAACPPVTFWLLASPERPAVPAEAPHEVQPAPHAAESAGMHEPAESTIEHVPPADAAESHADSSVAAASPSDPSQPTQSAGANWRSWQNFAPHLTLAYLIGVAAMLVRLALGLHGGQRLRKASQPVEDLPLLSALSRKARLIGLHFTPAVAYCRGVMVPTVIGVLRPTIVLPVSFASGLTAEQVEAILTHELAHIRRYDHLVNLLQRIIEAAFFFHPAVWLLSRQIRAEREHCCDDAVVAAGGKALSYAASLVHLAEASLAGRAASRLVSAAALGAAGKPSHRRRRVLRLLGGRSQEKLQLTRCWLAGLAVAASILAANSLFVDVKANLIAPEAADIALTNPLMHQLDGLAEGFFGAEDAQWLAYRTSSQPGQFGVASRWQDLAFAPGRPEGVELPDFTGADPVFAKWQTPMVKACFLWVALDRSRKDGPYDRLYIDSNTDGSLADERPIEPRHANGTAQAHHVCFQPAKVLFQASDGPVTYHLNVSWDIGPAIKTLRANAGGWYEGYVTVGGKTFLCRLVDSNVNGKFSDTSTELSAIDEIRIEADGRIERHFVGRYIRLDGVLYHPEVAHDGAYVYFTPAGEVLMGTVRVPKDVQELAAGGPNGLWRLQTAGGSAQLPLGTYHLGHWAVERTDETGARWKMTGQCATCNSLFEVTARRETQLMVGEPPLVMLWISKEGKAYTFNHQIKGRFGERIVLSRNGRPVGPSRLRIRSADGTYDRQFRFEDRGGDTLVASWREPSKIEGPFTATVEIDGPFEFVAKPRVIR